MPAVTRFAPSPTGYLHLGHALSAWAVKAMADDLDAKMLLRIEDIDHLRCKPEFEDALLSDLNWLGLEYDRPIVRQSERMDFYANAISRLKDINVIYPCSCTRKLVMARSPGLGPDGPLYAGHCRDAGPIPGRPVAWRLNMDAAISRVSGMIRDPRPWGDLILVRREIPTSYHLSVVTDDAHQGITHIMRGKDLQGITAVHELLQRLLDLPVPSYTFHELVLHDDGRKFSKSQRAPAIRDMRDRGLTPGDLRARLNRIPNLTW